MILSQRKALSCNLSHDASARGHSHFLASRYPTTKTPKGNMIKTESDSGTEATKVAIKSRYSQGGEDVLYYLRNLSLKKWLQRFRKHKFLRWRFFP